MKSRIIYIENDYRKLNPKLNVIFMHELSFLTLLINIRMFVGNKHYLFLNG